MKKENPVKPVREKSSVSPKSSLPKALKEKPGAKTGSKNKITGEKFIAKALILLYPAKKRITNIQHLNSNDKGKDFQT